MEEGPLVPTPFTDWKRELLHSRGLDRPDGRPLYRYRLSTAKFDSLESLLRGQIGSMSNLAGLDLVAAHLPGFPALFVLYAADWWRRRYNGGHWSWDPILRDLGANPSEWTTVQRSECVQRGLKDWGLGLWESGGLRFLGSIAVQGGLPLQLLAQARGKIGQILGRVLQLAMGSNVTQLDLQTWMESLQGDLPQSYRHPAIVTLLADVARTVLDLQTEAKLDASAGAVNQLNRSIPNWRERFPLPVEDDQARGMIEQLIQDAARVRIERQTTCLTLVRHLEQDADGMWKIRSILTLPETLKSEQISRLFDVPVEELPRTAELVLVVGNQRQETTVRRMAGHDAYRLERKPWGASDALAADEHILHLRAPDGRLWSAPATRGEALEEDLPWTFSVENGDFLRQGTGGVANTEAWLVLPERWNIQTPEGSEASEQGKLYSHNRRIIRIHGSIHVNDGASLTCRIRTGQAGSSRENFEWRGHRYWLDFISPRIVFKGLPTLYQVGMDDTARPVDGQTAWNGTEFGHSVNHIGPVTARYPATGEIKYRARMLLLPEDATVTIHSRNTHSGTICLENWKATGAKVLTPDIHLATHLEGDDLKLDLSASPGSPISEYLEIEVHWSNNTTPARVTVPFPAQGVLAFDTAGTALPNGSLLAAHLLTGVRLYVLAEQNASINLELNMGSDTNTFPLHLPSNSARLEIRLQEYAADIQALLSLNNRPDALVMLSVRIAGAEEFQIRLARYAARLEKNKGNICLETSGLSTLSPGMLAALPVLALRLERPGDEAILLASSSSEGVANGVWDFAPETREAGAWLIYPGPDAKLPFRPTLWVVRGENTADTDLGRAIGLMEQGSREAALDTAIQMMAANFLEPSWVDVDRLTSQIGHLSLSTLDLWRKFALNPYSMAALALRLAKLPQGFLDRFAQELPFAWEVVPFVAWEQAIKCLANQCEQAIGQDTWELVFQTHLRSRIQDLSARYGALDYLLGIASAEYLPENMKQLQGLAALGSQSTHRLFEGENGLMMQLRRFHANDMWPTGFNAIIERVSAFNLGEIESNLCPISFGYQDGGINLPLLLANQVALNQSQEWLSDPCCIQILRAHRAFDPDWFDEAFNLVIARCLSDGILSIQRAS